MISQDSPSSDQELEVKSQKCFPPFTSQPQSFVQPMFRPYIKGSKMDWTVNDSLYHRFLKWKLKCENILDCGLAKLPEVKKCKKVMVRSRDFGMHQYVSWCLPNKDLSLEVLWSKYKDFYNYLMIYHNTPLTGSLQSPMQIFQGRNVRSDLPMSNAARKQLGMQPEIIRNSDKHARLRTHNHNVDQHVMYQDSARKHWYQVVISSLCSEPRSYKIITRDGIVYRQTQSHLKPFTHQNKMSQSTKCVSSLMAQSNHRWPVKTESKKKSQVNNQSQAQTSRPKRDTKPPVKLDLSVL